MLLLLLLLLLLLQLLEKLEEEDTDDEEDADGDDCMVDGARGLMVHLAVELFLLFTLASLEKVDETGLASVDTSEVDSVTRAEVVLDSTFSSDSIASFEVLDETDAIVLAVAVEVGSSSFLEITASVQVFLGEDGQGGDG